MNQPFHNIGIIAKYASPNMAGTLASLIRHLKSHHALIFLDADSVSGLTGDTYELVPRSQLREECDLIVVLGGDGTFLDAARSVAGFNVPLLGVNLGRLGFLADIPPERMLTSVDKILAGNYKLEERFLLDGSVIRDGEVIYRDFAFNDVVVTKRDVARMIEFATHINGSYVSNHRADGLIIATPTGSTAYALSGGGPVVHPALEALVISPICPHTLSDRPIVVDASSEIGVTLNPLNTNPVQVTWDGQNSLHLEIGDQVLIRRSEFNIKLIHPTDYDYFSILRDKLHWGGDHFLR